MIKLILGVLVFIHLAIILAGCSHVETKKYYESGQLQEETIKSGMIWSEGKTFVVKP